jgi:hypothetical protein
LFEANNLSNCYYFVDEAGDGTLFDRKGKVIVGSEGCSSFFMLGLLRVDDVDSLSAEFRILRARLMADPYFKGVPSMQPEAKKTALAFHAKDDLPEVRKEVLSLLARLPYLRFIAVIRDKSKLVSYVHQKNNTDPSYRFDPNELYDYLVRRLFRDQLHKHDCYHIFFSRRGSSDRTQALRLALDEAQKRFAEKHQIPVHNAEINVEPGFPKDHPALQAVDYFLWTVQRLFERGEDRFLSVLWPSFRLVIDMDDTRHARYGMYYDKKRPLTIAAIQGRK